MLKRLPLQKIKLPVLLPENLQDYAKFILNNIVQYTVSLVPLYSFTLRYALLGGISCDLELSLLKGAHRF